MSQSLAAFRTGIRESVREAVTSAPVFREAVVSQSVSREAVPPGIVSQVVLTCVSRSGCSGFESRQDACSSNRSQSCMSDTDNLRQPEIRPCFSSGVERKVREPKLTRVGHFARQKARSDLVQDAA